MNGAQPGILLPIPPLARYLTFTLRFRRGCRPSLQKLQTLVNGEDAVVGLGLSLVSALQSHIPGLKSYQPTPAPGIDLPTTPAALWIWLRGHDRGALLLQSRALTAALSDAFTLSHAIDAFRYANFQDLSGFVDGTENPTGDAAAQTAFVQPSDKTPHNLTGSSFVAVQQWLHDLAVWDRFSPHHQNATFGRDKISNAEIADAPPSAHVKRAAQETFQPSAFLLRRSMPWTDQHLNQERAGLVFVSFSASLTPFEAIFNRMLGHEDSTTDALFQFSQPISGAYFWCPPLRNNVLDLSPLGL